MMDLTYDRSDDNCQVEQCAVSRRADGSISLASTKEHTLLQEMTVYLIFSSLHLHLFFFGFPVCASLHDKPCTAVADSIVTLLAP
jgi:hypothetical protein